MNEKICKLLKDNHKIPPHSLKVLMEGYSRMAEGGDMARKGIRMMSEGREMIDTALLELLENKTDEVKK